MSETVWGLTLIYQNSVAGLKLEYSPPEHSGWGAVLARLVDGKFPLSPIVFTEETVLNRLDVRDVAAERIHDVPKFSRVISDLGPLDVHEFTEIVDLCAADVLAGDFTIFDRLRGRVLARVLG